VAEEPKVSGRRWRVAKLPPLVSSTEAPEPAEPPEPPSPVAAPKPPKAPKAVIGLPWPNAATDEMAILEVEGKPMRLRRASPDFVVVEAPATVAVEGHPDVVPQRKRVHDEALKAHEKALRAHQIATEVHERAVAEAQQNLERVWHEMERDLRRKVRSEQPEVEALEMAKARIDAAREGVQERARGLTRSRAAEAKVPGHRVAPATADDGEIRALIEEMRAEMREIRSLIKQMREQAGHEEKQARATPGAGASPNLLAPNSQGGAGRAGAPGSSGGSTNHGQHSHAEGSESSSLAPLNTGSTAVGAGTGDRLIGVNGQRVGSRTEALRVARQQYGLGTRTFNTQWQHGDRVVERTYQAAGR
jgi:hypothetical protein